MPGLPESELQWRTRLANCGFSEDDVQGIMQAAVTIAEWNDAGASCHVVEMVRVSYKYSWYTVDGVKRLSRFVKGTLAGTSIADLIFIMAVSRVVQKVAPRISACNLGHSLPLQLPPTILGLMEILLLLWYQF